MSFLETEILPGELLWWLRRHGGLLLMWLFISVGVTCSALLITKGFTSWYKHNPAYAVETYVAKTGERAGAICAAERPTMGIDSCTEWVLFHNEPAFANGLQAGEKLLLPDGR